MNKFPNDYGNTITYRQDSSWFKMQSIHLYRLVGCWLSLILILICPLLASAHGGGTAKLANVEAGSYRLFVWTSPEPPQVGEMHFTVAVTQPTESNTAATAIPDEIVLGADVQIELESMEQTDLLVMARATHDATANKFFYEADLVVPTPGTWQVTVSVAGEAGSGSARYTGADLCACSQWARTEVCLYRVSHNTCRLNY